MVSQNATVDIKEFEQLQEKVKNVEALGAKTHDMVSKIFYLYFPQVQGQKGMYEEHEKLKDKVEEVENSILEIKQAHAKDRAYVVAWTSVLAFLFSIFGDKVKQLIGL
jgi:hypothetical protein